MTRGKSTRQGHPNVRSRNATRRTRQTDWKRWGLIVSGVLGFAVLVYLAQTAGGSSASNAETASLARENAGTEVRVLKGSHHTVYHSTAPLPTSDAPRPDGKPTLVWFSGTWCEFCEQMEPWANETAARFADRLAFVEKSVDHDRSAASRYGVRGTPTFVLIDANGRSIAQFFYQSSADAFRSAIEQALKLAGRA